jgi:imidazolonepropionase-like amidohydrolase
LGFDEINHIAFLISTFYQDSLYVPNMRAYSQVAAAVAPTFDVDSPDVTALIALLRTNGTVVDPTVNAFIPAAARGLPDGTDLIFGATLERLPPLQRRAYTPAPTTDAQEAVRAQAAAATYLRLIKRLYEGSVKMVAGTDNLSGLSLHGELELYERAGIPAPAVLQIATILPARVMKDELDYGSIAAGKVADLVIVRGRPAERIRDLRRTETVVRAGVVYSADELYRAAGLSPAVSSAR